MKSRDNIAKRIYYGMFKENPVLVLVIGISPILAVTTSAKNGLAIGMLTGGVLILTDFFISIIRKAIPLRLRYMAYVLIAAAFTTVASVFMQAYYPEINEALGVFIPLTCVNTCILHRCEDYAMKNNAFLSLFDGIGMGAGYVIGATLLGALRELIGSGTVFEYRIIPENFSVPIFLIAPGGFFMMALIVAIANKIKQGGR